MAFDPLRGITLQNIVDLADIECRRALRLDASDGDMRISSRICCITFGCTDLVDGKRVSSTRIQTHEHHRLHRWNQVTFSGISSSPTPTLPLDSCSSSLSFDAQTIPISTLAHRFDAPCQVSRVLSPDTFEVQLDTSDLCDHTECNDMTCWYPARASVSTSLNMYKISPEIVIPYTTCEEQLVRITCPNDAIMLRDAVCAPGDLTLRWSVSLPDFQGQARLLDPGLTIHGRLGLEGVYRKWYWSSGSGRASVWRTDERHGRTQEIAEPVLDGLAEMEDRINWAQLEKLQVGDVVVLRRGVAHAELFEYTPATVFVSHWWGEETANFIATLVRHDRYLTLKPSSFSGMSTKIESHDCIVPFGAIGSSRSHWVCTFCNSQHKVELGDSWCQSPFYRVLSRFAEIDSGDVVVVLDSTAAPLGRTWCIFEAYLCAKLQIKYLLFTSDGELSSCLESLDAGVKDRAAALANRVESLDLCNARASVDGDRRMILHAMQSTEGGTEKVEFIVKKNILPLRRILGGLQRAKDPVTGKNMDLEEDIVSLSIRWQHPLAWLYVALALVVLGFILFDMYFIWSMYSTWSACVGHQCKGEVEHTKEQVVDIMFKVRHLSLIVSVMLVIELGFIHCTRLGMCAACILCIFWVPLLSSYFWGFQICFFPETLRTRNFDEQFWLMTGSGCVSQHWRHSYESRCIGTLQHPEFQISLNSFEMKTVCRIEVNSRCNMTVERFNLFPFDYVGWDIMAVQRFDNMHTLGEEHNYTGLSGPGDLVVHGGDIIQFHSHGKSMILYAIVTGFLLVWLAVGTYRYFFKAIGMYDIDGMLSWRCWHPWLMVVAPAGSGKSIISKRLTQAACLEGETAKLSIRIPVAEFVDYLCVVPEEDLHRLIVRALGTALHFILAAFTQRRPRTSFADNATAVELVPADSHVLGEDASCAIGSYPGRTRQLDPVTSWAAARFGDGGNELIHQNDLIVYFDGLDEAGASVDKVMYAMAQWLKLRMRAGRRDYVIVTSRPDVLHPLRRLWLWWHAFSLSTIQCLDISQVEDLLRKRAHASGKAETEKERAVETLWHLASFTCLYERPLLATLFIDYVFAEGDINSQINEVMVIKFMLLHMVEESSNAIDGLDKDQLWLLIKQLSLAMTRHRERLFDAAKLAMFSTQEISNSIIEAMQRREFSIFEFANGSGQQLQFVHLMLQEYLAALHLYELGEDSAGWELKSYRSSRFLRGWIDGQHTVRRLFLQIIASRAPRDTTAPVLTKALEFIVLENDVAALDVLLAEKQDEIEIRRLLSILFKIRQPLTGRVEFFRVLALLSRTAGIAELILITTRIMVCSCVSCYLWNIIGGQILSGVNRDYDYNRHHYGTSLAEGGT